MVMTEAEIAGAINGGDEVTLEAEIVQGFHADEPLGMQMKQLGESRAADVADKMIEGFGDREGILLSVGQEVEIVEDGAIEVTQVVLSAERRLPRPSPNRSKPHQQRKRR